MYLFEWKPQSLQNFTQCLIKGKSLLDVYLTKDVPWFKWLLESAETLPSNLFLRIHRSYTYKVSH